MATALMQNWKLPESLVATIKHHLALDPAADYHLEAAIVHLAARIGDAFSRGQPLDEALAQADPRAWDATGLDIGRCESVDASVPEQLNGVVGMLFPKLGRVAAAS